MCLFVFVPLIGQKSVAQETQQEVAMATISDLAKAGKKAAFCRNSREMFKLLTLNGENENDPALYQLFLGALVGPVKIIGDAALIDWNAHVTLSNEVSNVIQKKTCQWSKNDYPRIAALMSLQQDYRKQISTEKKEGRPDPCGDKIENAMALVGDLLRVTFSQCEEVMLLIPYD
jgi:hypothetical protein